MLYHHLCLRALLIQIGIELPYSTSQQPHCLRALLIQIGIEHANMADGKRQGLRALLIQIGIELIDTTTMQVIV